MPVPRRHRDGDGDPCGGPHLRIVQLSARRVFTAGASHGRH
jgi:hypothetical protein